MAGDASRVVLKPSVAGTDYVNASWVPGYSGDRAFIISQHPNNFSLEQFWHMVWQTDTRTIICLSAFQQPVSGAVTQNLSNIIECSSLSRSAEQLTSAVVALVFKFVSLLVLQALMLNASCSYYRELFKNGRNLFFFY